MNVQEAIKAIRQSISKQRRSGTLEQYDSFINGMEYCLSLLEERAPEYRKKELDMECEFYINLFEETGATVEIDNGRVTAINPPEEGVGK